MKTTLNGSSVIIKLSAKERRNLEEDSSMSIFVTQQFQRLSKRYKKLHLTGKWTVQGDKVYLYREEDR